MGDSVTHLNTMTQTQDLKTFQRIRDHFIKIYKVSKNVFSFEILWRIHEQFSNSGGVKGFLETDHKSVVIIAFLAP